MNKSKKFTFIEPVIALALISIFSLRTCRNIEKETLITTTGYPLTNGYGYLVVGPGEHLLLKRPISSDEAISQVDYIDLGYHLNRLYFDSRYIAGEITKQPNFTEHTDLPGKEKRYSYFIVDTETHNYLLDLNESEFEVELKRLEIHESVELSSRDESNWLKKQRP